MFYTASEETYKDGQTIIEEGASGDWVYVIMSGEVEISKCVGEKKFVIELLKPGEVFGELGFFGGIPRTATAKAVGETTVGVIDRAFLDQEFNKLSSAFRTILRAVVDRFKKMLDRSCDFTTRTEIRVLETLSISYEDREAFVGAYTGNVSTGGLFIGTENPLEQGEQFLLKLKLPGVLDPIRIKCEVAWMSKGSQRTEHSAMGMGVKFVEMTKKDHQIMMRHLEDISKSKENVMRDPALR